MKQIKRTIIDLVPVGFYLTDFELVYNNRCNPGEHEDCLEHGCFDNDSEYVQEVIAHITKITAKNYKELSIDVTLPKYLEVLPLWEGDTHDLRPRIFKTKHEATTHTKNTLDRFNNARPWECFIKVA